MKAGTKNSQSLSARAVVYLRRGEWNRAIDDFEDSLKMQPKNPTTLYGLGVAEIRKGAKADGEKHQQAALAIAPNAAEIFKRMGM
jgi:tetratricopeptide (TPR) repeat protein